MAQASTQQENFSPTLRVMPVVVFNLLVYFVIGLPNAVIGAIFVHHALGFSTALAGVTITTQYLGTFATRLFAGKLVDKHGPKKILTAGMIACAASGFLMIATAVFASRFDMHNESLRYASLVIALISRLFMGAAESWTATSVTTWNIRKVGLENASVAISWNGVTTYGGIAIGVIVGQWLASLADNSPQLAAQLTPIGISAFLLPLVALVFLTFFYEGPKPLERTKGNTLSLYKALCLVLPYGIGLATGSFGFGAINAFLALYYQANNWGDVGLAFLVFSLVFIGTRLGGTSLIKKKGGVPVAMVSLTLEGIAFIVLTMFDDQLATLIGVGLTAGGFSLVFPALGTEAVKTGGPQNSGTLLAAYSIFTDLTVFIVGPVMGSIKDEYSWKVMFGVIACLSFAGILLTLLLLKLPKPEYHSQNHE